ncbi:MAG: family 43 glycosylhydrolase, partial [Prevotellaceae bacterium]|nr:family 43 glycosylhydrolase [Prevotellaceae bacterium]
ETDPALFLDDDGRLYYYGGCSNRNPILGAEIDRKTLDVIGEPVKLIGDNHDRLGWEVRGDYNSIYDDLPWIEGAWMNKRNGKYYLQYASPGTEFNSYNDAVYVSDKPLGPFTVANHNPFAYKPAGFATGAGHGSTFTDIYGNCWHFGTVTISIREGFERRLALFPTFFDSDGEMYAYTGFGDYPMIVPNKKISTPEELFPSWMLLSYNKKVDVSSTFEGFNAQNAVDENLRTWWSASSGDKGEYFAVDLGALSDIYAIQVNFADQDAKLRGRNEDIYYQYIIEHSVDGKKWKTLVDKSENREDVPHDYIQLQQPVKSRHIRIVNVRVPSGKFSLSGLRVFGKGNKEAPKAVSSITLERMNDRRGVKLKWEAVEDATGYNVRFGIHKDKLYHNYLVYGKNNVTINALNSEKTYFYTVDSFNENGVSRSALRVKN